MWVDVTIADGSMKNIPTYIAPLLTDPAIDGYDPLLVDTIAWCMAHKPADRPTMQELEQRISSNVFKDWSDEDDTGRLTIRDLLAMPPPPRPAQ